jgi:predicted TIM-barrel fold metal-dependent hydrolase
MNNPLRRRFSFRGCACCETSGAAFSRRSVLGGATVLGLSAVGSSVPPKPALAQAQSQAQPQGAGAGAKAHRIDIHHHITPPKYLAEFGPKHELQRPTQEWTLAKSLDDMDKAGVATSITSVTTPGRIFSGSDGRRVARECNDYAATLVADHRGRFGMFAALPLTDTEGSLREIEYALDTLHADGIALFTSYGDKWLGDPSFEPVMAELGRRKAVVYTHPDAPNCCRDPLLPDLRESVIEYGTDTTRAIARLLSTGTALRYRDIRWIFSHGGGTAPFLVERLIRAPAIKKAVEAAGSPGVMAELQRFYYDVAQIAHPVPLLALQHFAPISQILWGTDFPFRRGEEYVKALATAGFSEADLRKIDRDNALTLLPRFRAG